MQHKIKERIIWAKSQLNNKVVKNVIIVASLTLVVKLLGFYKETMVASTYGLSTMLDTYYIAFLIPAFIQSVFLVSFKNVFIPNYVSELAAKGNMKSALGSFQAVCFLMVFALTVLLIGLTLLFDLYLLEYVFPNHEASYYTLIRSQLYLLIPCLLFWGFSSLISGLLEINNKFLVSSIYPIFISLSVIFCLLYLGEQLKEKLLAVGTLAGSLIGFGYLLTVAILSKIIKIEKPVIGRNTKIMLRQIPAKITSSFMTGMNGFVDQFFAAQLVVGSISAINYGIKVPTFILGFSMVALGNVLLPHFSKKIQANLKDAFTDLYSILKNVFVIGLILVAVIFIFSEDIIRILFERNEFTSDNTLVVTNVQRIILIYVPFYLCGNILVKFLTSLNKNSFLAWISVFNFASNLVLNIILVRKFGLYGIALSTTIVITTSSFIYFYKSLALHKQIASK